MNRHIRIVNFALCFTFSTIILSWGSTPCWSQIWASTFSFEPNSTLNQQLLHVDSRTSQLTGVLANEIVFNDSTVIDLTLAPTSCLLNSAPGSECLRSFDRSSTTAIFDSFDVRGDTVYSLISPTEVELWNTAAESRQIIDLEDSVSHHTLGLQPPRIDLSNNGDLFFHAAGFGTQQRNIVRFSANGEHLVDYVHPNLNHVLGSVAATDDALFAISRFRRSGEWVQEVLMFNSDGEFLGDFTAPNGLPQDLEVRNNQLVVIGVSDDATQPGLGGLSVFDLDGSQLPRFSHNISFPDGVSPDIRHLDGVEYANGKFYLSETRIGAIHELNHDGQLLRTYDLHTNGTALPIGKFIVVPEPSSIIMLLMALAAGLWAHPTR